MKNELQVHYETFVNPCEHINPCLSQLCAPTLQSTSIANGIGSRAGPSFFMTEVTSHERRS